MRTLCISEGKRMSNNVHQETDLQKTQIQDLTRVSNCDGWQRATAEVGKAEESRKNNKSMSIDLYQTAVPKGVLLITLTMYKFLDR